VTDTGSGPFGTQSEAQNVPMLHRPQGLILLGAMVLAASALSAPPAPTKISFSLSGASSDLVLSSDETRILFAEDGVLKAVDLVSGSVLSVRRLPAGYGRLTAIPSHDDAFVFAAQYGDSKGPHQIWIGHLSGGEDISHLAPERLQGALDVLGRLSKSRAS